MASLKRAALVTFVAGIGAFACRTAAPVSKPSDVTAPAVASTLDRAGTIWLIFVDDLHLDFRRTGHIKELLKRIAIELIQDGDSFAVVSSGPSSLAIDLTSDRGLLEGAIRKTSGAGLNALEILDAGRGPGLPAELLYRADVALSTANDMVNGAQQAAGRRKALIYISNGYDFEQSSNKSVPEPTVKGVSGRTTSVAGLRGQVSSLIRHATASRIRIFAIDPRAFGPPPTPDPRVSPDALAAHLAATRKSLRFIAEQTGGFAEHDDLAGSLKRIGAAMRGPQ